MSLINIIKRFPNHKTCIDHLEKVRWGDTPTCPHCGSDHVARKVDGDRVGRWNCHSCKSSFNVLSGTIFQSTQVPLQKWFLAIMLMLNAKKSLSGHQLARDVGIGAKAGWRLAMKIRTGMRGGDLELLRGIVEADETYVGGKPRKANNPDDNKSSKRGRGTDKTAIMGIKERGGKVVAKSADKLTFDVLSAFIEDNVDTVSSTLITDEFKGYKPMGDLMEHKTIDHSKAFVDGNIHTNNIESFWAIVKRAWFGQHHHYSRRYTDLYIQEACYKQNMPKDKKGIDLFNRFINSVMIKNNESIVF